MMITTDRTRGKRDLEIQQRKFW